jgi:hypothetical protein
VGGPGKSLDRNYHYQIEKDINFIAERTSNTNVRFINRFEWHDDPWKNEMVRSLNLHLAQDLMGRGTSHTGVTDMTSIAREEYTTPWPSSKFARQEEAYASHC